MSDRRTQSAGGPGTDGDGDAPFVVDRRHVLVSLLVAAVLGVGVWLLIGHAASYARLLEHLRRADPWWFALCLAGVVATYLGYALLFRAVAHVLDGPRPPLRVALRVAVGAFAASVVATSAGRLGVEYWAMRRMDEDAPQAWSRVLAINTAQWAMLSAGACLAAAALLAGAGDGAPLGVELAWLLALPVLLPAALYVSSPARPGLAEDRGGKVRRAFAAAVRGLVMLRAVTRSRDGRAAVGGLALYWAGEMVCLWAALRAFGIDLGPAAVVVAYATGYVSTTLPLPAGGAGGVDSATTYAVTLVGVALSPALLGTLAFRLFTYWVPLVPAVLGARSLKRLGGDLAAVRDACGPRAG